MNYYLYKYNYKNKILLNSILFGPKYLHLSEFYILLNTYYQNFVNIYFFKYG